MPMTERFFNTTGPVVPADHYCVPPLERFDLVEILRLIRTGRYFVLHAPRQTGKTSGLLALRDLLNGSGEYRCLYVNVESGQSARGDVEAAMRAILGRMATLAQVTLKDDFPKGIWQEALAAYGGHGALGELLTRWSMADAKPLVLFIDEIDSLVGDTLISVLRQLRAGYEGRPAAFPQSVILCGVRDVRDYRIRSDATQEVIAGGSAFNIKAKSLRLGDFTEAEVRALLGQHAAETGQAFTRGALAAVWRQTQGQPWLVNALAWQACFEDRAGRDRSRPIAEEAVMEAQEELVLSRQTHLHQLADKLEEPRVRRVIEPLLSGGAEQAFTARDVEYVRDLGLIARDNPVRVANPVYAEVIPRELTYAVQAGLLEETAWYVRADGGLDVEGLLAAFQRFFREHSEHAMARFDYREAAAQLLLQAFLQRVVNGGGRIEREYALGRRRTDLLIVWPPGKFAQVAGRGGDAAESGEAAGGSRAGGGQAGTPRRSTPASEAAAPPRRYVIECKILHGGLGATIREGARQTLDYMDRCGAESGHLVVFDRDPGKSWEEKIFRREESLDGRTVAVWGA